MTTKQPGQDVYDLIFEMAESLDYEVYQFKPPKGTPYPFVHVDWVQEIPSPDKGNERGKVYAHVDVWSGPCQRREVTDMAHKIIGKMAIIRKTREQRLIKLVNQSVETRQEQTNTESLWRAQLQLQFDYFQ